MPLKVDKYKDYMASLSDNTLQKIVNEDFADYEFDALEAAKLELNRRIESNEFVDEDSNIINSNVSGYIKLMDVISAADFDKILEEIIKLDPETHETIGSYRQVINQLLKISPLEESNIQVIIEKNIAGSKDWGVFGIDTNTEERFGIEFFPWNEWLAFWVSTEIVKMFGLEKIAALCLLKMTTGGFSEEEIQHQLLEIQNDFNIKSDNAIIQIEPASILSQNTSPDDAISNGIKILIKEKDLGINLDIPQVRPWIRFWARIIDDTLWGALLYNIWYGISPDSYERANPILKYITIFPLFWTFIEALLLSTWGTTPGKWLLNVCVREDNGEKLSYKRALYRSLFVWTCGNGCGLLYLGYIAYIASYFRLTNRGTTWWDDKGKFIVTHKRIDLYRSLTAAAIILIIPLILYFF